MPRRLLITLFALSVLVPAAVGRRPVRLPDNGRSNSIMVLAQDLKGFIWVGTNEGLLYYDGYSYSGITDVNCSPAVRGRIRCLLPDDEGRIWVGTEEGAVVYYPEKMEGRLLDGPTRGSAVKAILKTPAGDFAVFSTNGIDIIDGVSFESHFLAGDEDHPHYFNLRLVFPGPDGDFWTGHEDNLIRLSFKTSRFNPDIRVWETSGRMKLRGIDSKGTVYYNDGAGDLRICSLPDDRTSIADAGSRILLPGIDTRGILFTANRVEVTTSYSGIFDFTLDAEGRLGEPSVTWIDDNDHTDIANSIMCAAQSRDGNLFYGTTGGLFMMKAEEESDFHVIPGGGGDNLTHNVVADIYSADGKCFWVATSGGLDELRFENDIPRITHHELPPRLIGDGSSSRLQCISSIGDGVLWMGTKNGILKFDMGSGRYSVPIVLNAATASREATFCKTLQRLKDGQILAGFIYGGLFLFDPATDKCSQILLGGEDIAASSIFKLTVDKDDRVWVATSNKGVYYFDPSGLEADGSDLLVSAFSHYSPGNGAVTYSLCSDSDGRMIACTSKGLFELPEGAVGPRQLSDPDVPVNFVAEDPSGDFWASTISGLLYCSHDFSESIFFDTGTSSFSQMDYNTGACVAADGNMLFGGVSGLTRFDPRRTADRHPGKKVHITGASVMGKGIPVPADGRFRLGWRDRQLGLSLSTLTYPADLSRVYYYNLKESGWIPLKGNVLSFANLSPGDYRLSLSCDNIPSAGDAVSTFEITVSPPWWAEWWAKCLYVLLTLLVAGGVINFIIERNRQKNRMNTLLGITHGMKTPLSLMKIPVAILKKENLDKDGLLDIVDHNTEKISDTVNQLLELRKVDQKRTYLHLCRIDLADFLSKTGQYFAPVFGTKDIAFSVNIPDAPCEYTCDPDKIEIVVFNLLQNAYTFTPAGGEVAMSLETAGDRILIKVRDNGIGIDRKYHRKAFERFWQYHENGVIPSRGSGIGLAVVKAFVKMHGGRVDLDSAIGKGSEFTVSLPANRFHGVPDEVIKIEPEYIRQYAPSVGEIPLAAETGDGSASTILVVSGDGDMVSLLSGILGRYLFISTSSTDEAFCLAGSEHPEMVIINIEDAGKEASLNLCKKMKADFKLRDIPVVYLTNEDSPGEAKLYYELGADSHISKPFDPDLLKARVKQLLEKRQNYREKIKVEAIMSSFKGEEMESADDRFLKKVLEVVEAAIPDEDFSLDVFADRMNASKTNLNDRLRSITGRSPMEFLRKARMQRAAQLLGSGAYDVSQVCYMVGFSDPRYFATCFKKEFGCTPSSYSAGK